MLRIKDDAGAAELASGLTIPGEPMSVVRDWQRRSPVLSDPQLTRYLLAAVVSMAAALTQFPATMSRRRLILSASGPAKGPRAT